MTTIDSIYTGPCHCAEIPSWHNVTHWMPVLTETTPEGIPRSRTVLLRDKEHHIRLGYCGPGGTWRLLGPEQKDWTNKVQSWQWMVEN